MGDTVSDKIQRRTCIYIYIYIYIYDYTCICFFNHVSTMPTKLSAKKPIVNG